MAVHDHFCSRDHSRQARKIIAKSIYPYLGKDPALAIPEVCPLHPALDVFKDQEAHKRLVPGKKDTFQCGYCQKQFKTEFYMDRHMDNKHHDRLNLDLEAGAGADADDDIADNLSSGRCLGDLCPVLGCGEYDTGDCSVEIGSAAGGDGGGKGTIRRGCGMCDPADMERRRRDCLALFGRCLDVSDGAAYGGVTGVEVGHFGELRDHFVRQFCDHLACDSHNRPLAPRWEGKGAARRHPIPGGVGDGRSGMGMPKMFIIAVLVVGLIILYSTMALGHWSRRTQKDLRHLSHAPRSFRRREEIGSNEGDSGRSTSIRGSSALHRRGLNRGLG